jgi:hypothetical protein
VQPRIGRYTHLAVMHQPDDDQPLSRSTPPVHGSGGDDGSRAMDAAESDSTGTGGGYCLLNFDAATGALILKAPIAQPPAEARMRELFWLRYV